MAKHSQEVKSKMRAVLARKAREGKPTKDRAEIEKRKKPMSKRYDAAGDAKDK